MVAHRFPYRLAAIDLDNTLLGPDERIGVENRRAVQAMVELGLQIVLASGRHHEDILRFQRQLGLSGAIVSSNGSLVQDPRSGEEIYGSYVARELGIRVCKHGLSTGRGLILYHPQRVCEYTIETARDDCEAMVAEPILKIIWVADPRDLPELRNVQAAHYPECEVVCTGPEYLEFLNKNATKAKALAKLASVLEIPRSEVVAFGDGNNDASMLAWAGLGIAMPHGCASALAAADRVGPAGNPETAFARAVDSLLAVAQQKAAI